MNIETSYHKNDIFKVVVISNITLEPYFISHLKKYFINSKIIPSVEYIFFSEYVTEHNREILNEASLIIVWINLEYLVPNMWCHLFSKRKEESVIIDELLLQASNLYRYLKSNSISQIIWLSFEDYYVKFPNSSVYVSSVADEINIRLNTLIDQQDSLIDLKKILANIGLVDVYDEKKKYRWNSPYSKQTIDRVTYEIYFQYLSYTGSVRKCIVLDCDNVLWGGVISEEGVSGITLGDDGPGRQYQDFQRYILGLYFHGLIIAICSKNDESDILTVFREHDGMLLKEEHISCVQANWNKKSSNIISIANELNISLNSIVFVDDSPVEIAEVRHNLPEVKAVQYTPYEIYSKLSFLSLKNVVNIDDINKRTKTYKTNGMRKELLVNSSNDDDFIKNLQLNVDIHNATVIESNRISELTQRTNKCTNGCRYTVKEIVDKVKSESTQIFAVTASDRFSELGLIGSFVIKDNVLEMLSLSCRALGRGIEKIIIDYIKSHYEINKIQFIFTTKNSEFKSMLNKEFPSADIISLHY